MKTRLRLLLLASFRLSFGAEQLHVEVEQGKVSGHVLDEKTHLHVFRGIPYATPPIGELRWRLPKPPKKWEGVRKCDQFSAAAPQKLKNNASILLSEDCLYLNIWTKRAGKPEANLPVMVWIHGGGLNQGYGHKGYSDGEGFANRNVVLVSLNYRLGALGFLAHPDLSAESPRGVSGNYGLFDQIAALHWVKRNIKAFGGDPNKVTIFGESAGGTSVSALCSSPLAKGLFAGAIMQSPWMFGYVNKLAEPNIVRLKDAVGPVGSAEKIGLKYADGQSIKDLRKLSGEDIVARSSYYKTRVTIDGWLLSDHPAEIFSRGEQADVPTMIGTTKNEGAFFWYFAKSKSRKVFADKLKAFYQDKTDAVLALYPGESQEELQKSAVNYITDSWFVQPARQLLEGMRKVKSPTYQYEFVKNGWAPHAAELKYVFNTHVDSKDDFLAKLMADQWVQFAKTGDPNGEGLPSWPPYKIDREYLRIGDEISVGKALKKNVCDVLDVATRGLYNSE
jgi:para-nitrobenzyl esterase